MGISWRDAAETVAKVAPGVATALGGPGIGAAAGLATRFITDTLGIENTPEAMVAAAQNPDMVAELKRLELTHKEKLESLRLEEMTLQMQEESKRLAEVNATMRAELTHDGIFKSGWRPALGWVFAASVGVLVSAMAYTIARDPGMLGNQEFTGMLIWLFVTMGAVLGVNVRERSKDKMSRRGLKPAGFMSQIMTRRE